MYCRFVKRYRLPYHLLNGSLVPGHTITMSSYAGQPIRKLVKKVGSFASNLRLIPAAFLGYIIYHHPLS